MFGFGRWSGQMAWGPPVTSASIPGGYGDGVKRRDQIQMSDDEVRSFLDEARTMTMCTFNHDGTIHAVAMWFGFLGSDVAVETKTKSQKALNLRRDPRITCLVEAGEVYGELRGVELVGWAEEIENPDELFAIGVSVYERNVARYDESQRPAVEAMLNKRVGFRVHAERTVSWDHRKLAVRGG
jgi:PPOX class probable F420-dependent enzyme